MYFSISESYTIVYLLPLLNQGKKEKKIAVFAKIPQNYGYKSAEIEKISQKGLSEDEVVLLNCKLMSVLLGKSAFLITPKLSFSNFLKSPVYLTILNRRVIRPAWQLTHLPK